MISSAGQKNHTKKVNKGSESVKTASEWIQHYTGPGYGHTTIKGVRHEKTECQLQNALNMGWNIRIPLYRIVNHCCEDDTLYYTGSATADYLFLMIDVDVLKALMLGSIEGGRSFIKYLGQVFPNLYTEESTHHKGQHGYLRLHCPGVKAEERRTLARKLDAYVKWLAKTTNADIECVEVKGSCKIISYKNGPAKIENMGLLAKLPRGLLTNLEEIENTAALSVEDVERLYASIPSEEQVQATSTSMSHGSGAILTPDMKSDVDKLAKLCLINRLSNIATSDRHKVYAQDFGYGLLLLRQFYDLKNEDDSLANRRVEKLWNDGVAINLHNKMFNPRVWKVIRDKFSELGLIDWLDNSYVPGQTLENGEVIKGVAMKWRLHSDAVEIVDDVLSSGTHKKEGAITADTSNSLTFPELRGRGEFLLPFVILRVTTRREADEMEKRPLPGRWEYELDRIFALAG